MGDGSSPRSRVRSWHTSRVGHAPYHDLRCHVRYRAIMNTSHSAQPNTADHLASALPIFEWLRESATTLVVGLVMIGLLVAIERLFPRTPAPLNCPDSWDCWRGLSWIEGPRGRAGRACPKEPSDLYPARSFPCRATLARSLGNRTNELSQRRSPRARFR